MPPPPRRTQTNRRADTRAAILDAAIRALVDVGYARATTTEIAARASVSQGALFKHFPNKAALVAAAAEALFATLIGRFGEAIARERSERSAAPPVVIAMRRLWELFCDPSLRAVYLLFAEAPADAVLCASLRPVVRHHEEAIVSQAAALFPELVEDPRLAALFDGVLFAMQGLSLQRPVWVDEVREAALLQFFERLATEHFPPDSTERQDERALPPAAESAGVSTSKRTIKPSKPIKPRKRAAP
jgi:AcrR family transcriptional regulator